MPELRVRRGPDEPLDPVLVRQAMDALERKAAELALEPLRRASEPQLLTLGEAYRMFFDPRRRALPPSKEARQHHRASREFWESRLGVSTAWNTITPADVRGPLIELREAGKIATAEKRLQNLRTLYRWLREQMRMRGLEDPTLGIRVTEITAGYEPRRPRYSADEIARLREAWQRADPRFRLFMALVTASGARAGQVRLAMRSGVDAPLDPAPPPGAAPHGWLVLPAVKKQRPMVTFLTSAQRRELDSALAGYLATWEAEYQAGTREDYPLIPGGYIDRGELLPEPISDTALRKTLHEIERAAGVARRPRRGFHGFRRAWVDLIDSVAGLDTATAAGGWSRRELVEGVYVSPRRWEHLARAREIMEHSEDGP
ncbi:MAG TPA: hypothetical protein VIL25_01450 [Vicinamibacterales bacterium]